ncbi:helix-turn-helix domain-containing protein [Streptomyces yanii]|uniref:Helix-turn-helix domain-containing protein n=1 Tax=Streptomyces yanii TaxID=78510 RepID=A0ABV5RGH1_9ACTN
MLEVLGVDSVSEAVYAVLLSARPATSDELALTTGRSPARVRSALRSLQCSGLVSRRSGRPVTYVAIDPEVALDGLLLTRQEQLRQARVRVTEFTERFRRSAATRDPAQVIEVITGATAVAQRADQAIRGALHEIRVFDRPPYVSRRDLEPNEPELELLARGGTARALYETDGINRPDRLNLLRMWAAAGEKARVLPALPTKMALIDDRLAILPLRPGSGPDSTPSLVVVHRSGVIDALSALFEVLWAIAPPLQFEDANPADLHSLPADDRLMLSLMTAGLPDEAIARQLGMSYRTLQRRLRVLMDRAHARTRFQLGLQAVANGWVSPPGVPDPGTGQEAGEEH